MPEFRNVKNMMDLVAVVKANPGEIFRQREPRQHRPSDGCIDRFVMGLEVGACGLQGDARSLAGGGLRTHAAGHVGTAVEDPQKFPGKVINIASSALKRNPDHADIPTLAESGFPAWTRRPGPASFAPVGIPRPIMDRLVAESTRRPGEHPDTQARLGKSLVLEHMPPAEFMTLMKQTVTTWGRVIKEQNPKS